MISTLNISSASKCQNWLPVRPVRCEACAVNQGWFLSRTKLDLFQDVYPMVEKHDETRCLRSLRNHRVAKAMQEQRFRSPLPIFRRNDVG